MSAPSRGALGVLVALTLAACAKPAKPSAAPAASETAAAAPAPPPPKCESLDEKCEGKEGARARIGASGFDVAPPKGWVYAQEADAFVATTTAAALAMRPYDLPKPAPAKKGAKAGDKGAAAAAARAEAFGALVQRLELGFKKTPPWPKKPQKTLTVAGLKVDLVQFDGATRGGKKGPVLGFHVALDAEHALVGAGFVAEDDDANADQAILSAVESLAHAPEGAAGGAPSGDAKAEPTP